MKQPGLFSRYDDAPRREKPDPSATGRELRDRGMAIADANEDELWKNRADRVIAALASSKDPFTAEDVRRLAGSPGRPNAFGARFRVAARKGIIERVGYARARRPSLHAHPIALWRGKLAL